MKSLIIILLLIVTTPVFAQYKITEYTRDTNMSDDDIVSGANSPASSPTNAAYTLGALKTYINAGSSSVTNWSDLEGLKSAVNWGDESTYLSSNAINWQRLEQIQRADINWLDASLYVQSNNGNIGVGTTATSRGRVEIKQLTDSNTSGLAIINSTLPILSSLRLWTNSTGFAHIDSGIGGSPLIINLNNGNVGIGSATPTNSLDIIAGNGLAGITTSLIGDNSNGSGIILKKARGAIGAYTATLSGDGIGQLLSFGYNGSAYTVSSNSAILMNANENFSVGSNGTYMSFQNTPNGSSTRSENMRIMGSGNIGISTSNPLALLDITSTAARDLFIVNDNGFGDTSPFVISSTGNVGIGSATPNGALVVRTSASDIGWTRQSGANTACNTTCTASCVFGQNTGDMAIVDCADATADVCICAGSN